MVSTVLAVSLPMLSIEPVNFYTCKKWLLTETVDSSISYVDSNLVTSGSVFSTCRQIGNTHVMAEGLIGA